MCSKFWCASKTIKFRKMLTKNTWKDYFRLERNHCWYWNLCFLLPVKLHIWKLLITFEYSWSFSKHTSWPLCFAKWRRKAKWIKRFANLSQSCFKLCFLPYFQIKKKPKLLFPQLHLFHFFLHISNASPLVCVLRMSLYIVKVFISVDHLRSILKVL